MVYRGVLHTNAQDIPAVRLLFVFMEDNGDIITERLRAEPCVNVIRENLVEFFPKHPPPSPVFYVLFV